MADKDEVAVATMVVDSDEEATLADEARLGEAAVAADEPDPRIASRPAQKMVFPSSKTSLVTLLLILNALKKNVPVPSHRVKSKP